MLGCGQRGRERGAWPGGAVGGRGGGRSPQTLGRTDGGRGAGKVGDGRGWPQRSPWALAAPCPVLERTWRRAMLGGPRGSGWGAFPGLRLPAAVGRRSRGTEAQGCAAAVTSHWARAREPPHPLLGFKKSQKQYTLAKREHRHAGTKGRLPAPAPPKGAALAQPPGRTGRDGDCFPGTRPAHTRTRGARFSSLSDDKTT